MNSVSNCADELEYLTHKLFQRFLFAALLLLGTHGVAQAKPTQPLSIDIFVSEPHEINTTSTLIMGETEMMVVCAQPNISSAQRLVQRLKKTGLELKYIFLTHAHMDHFQGASILLDAFPSARFIASPKIASLQKMRINVSDEIAESRYGDNAAIPSVAVEAFHEDTLFIDGKSVELMHGYVGDAVLGEADEEHTVLYVPSAHTLIPSDIVYFNAHVMMGGSTKKSRAKWKAQLKNWLAQKYDVVVPGHMPKGSNLTAEGALRHTLSYINAYEDVIANYHTPDEVISEMKKRFPSIKHESALVIGTYIDFRKMHKLSFSPTIEAIFSILPDGVSTWLDNRIYEQRRAQWNGTKD